MYDVIIIGAGPAGISASLYTKRANLETLVIYKEQSSLQKANKIENYYGFENGITGKDIYINGINQAKNIGVDVKEEEVTKISFNETGYIVSTEEKQYKAKVLIIATGNKKNNPQIEGIKEFEGRGVSYCAVCDGFFYKNRNVVVLGSGNYAIAEANELIELAKKITILTNGEKAPQIRNNNVEIETKKIKKVGGQKVIQEVEFEDGSKIETDGVFVAQGVAGTTEFAKKLGILTKNNNIVINENMETNIKGIYACGDCTGGILQISKAVYEGTKAGLEAIKYIRENR